MQPCCRLVQHREQNRFKFSMDVINLIQCKGRAKVELLQKKKRACPWSEVLYQEIPAHLKKKRYLGKCQRKGSIKECVYDGRKKMREGGTNKSQSYLQTWQWNTTTTKCTGPHEDLCLPGTDGKSEVCWHCCALWLLGRIPCCEAAAGEQQEKLCCCLWELSDGCSCGSKPN